eukprot:757303-Amphidinium_carterae.1
MRIKKVSRQSCAIVQTIRNCNSAHMKQCAHLCKCAEFTAKSMSCVAEDFRLYQFPYTMEDQVVPEAALENADNSGLGRGAFGVA